MLLFPASQARDSGGLSPASIAETGRGGSTRDWRAPSARPAAKPANARRHCFLRWFLQQAGTTVQRLAESGSITLRAVLLGFTSVREDVKLAQEPRKSAYRFKMLNLDGVGLSCFFHPCLVTSITRFLKDSSTKLQRVLTCRLGLLPPSPRCRSKLGSPGRVPLTLLGWRWASSPATAGPACLLRRGHPGASCCGPALPSGAARASASWQGYIQELCEF